MRGYKGRDRRFKTEVDHIVPLSGGGAHHPDNMRCCCGRCNLVKGSKTLQATIAIYSGHEGSDSIQKQPPPLLNELIAEWRKAVLPKLD
jgi:hypothetical protein